VVASRNKQWWRVKKNGRGGPTGTALKLEGAMKADGLRDAVRGNRS
jgi:hypothetical protein